MLRVNSREGLLHDTNACGKERAVETRPSISLTKNVAWNECQAQDCRARVAIIDLSIKMACKYRTRRMQTLEKGNLFPWFSVLSLGETGIFRPAMPLIPAECHVMDENADVPFVRVVIEMKLEVELTSQMHVQEVGIRVLVNKRLSGLLGWLAALKPNDPCERLGLFVCYWAVQQGCQMVRYGNI